MATEPRPLISEDLLHQVEETARAQNRQPEEVVTEAVRKYLDEQRWMRALGYGRQRATAVGITTEEGIDKAIADWRRENHKTVR
jgi:metal-responsive CopG/Arc/MetJ family transcriptional regulator